MVFKKEVKYGAKILSCASKVGDETLHAVKNADTNEDLCVISAEWV